MSERSVCQCPRENPFMRSRFVLILSAVFIVSDNAVVGQAAPATLGIFEGQSDVGSVVPPGTLAYDAASGDYTVTAAGANLWSTTDGFHFIWKEVSGDVALTADVKFPDSSGNP